MFDLQLWLLAAAVLAVTGFANLATKRIIEARVKLEFDGKLEALKTEQRVREETLKSDLRSAESQIAALRDGALSRRAARDALLDKRRIEAAELVWAQLATLTGYRLLVFMTTTIQAVVEKRDVRTEGFQKMFEAILKPFPETGPGFDAKRQQLFVSPPAWAYFSAYNAIVAGCFAQAKMFALGVETKESLMDQSAVHELILAALPDAQTAIEQFAARSYYHILDRLEAKLLEEINRSLEGATADEAHIRNSAAIIKLVNSVNSESTRTMAEGVAIASGTTLSDG